VNRWTLILCVLLCFVVACDRSSRGRGSSTASVGPAGPPGPPGPRGLPGRSESSGSQMAQGIFDVTTFGALGDGFTDDTGAIQSAINAAHDVGGGIVWFPPGRYPISRPLEISNMNRLTFSGSGVDSTILQSTSPTEPIFNSDTDGLWRTWEEMTLTSTVTKTAGALMELARERRAVIRHVKFSGFFDGIHLDSFEVVLFDFLHMANPSGPGTAIVVGVPANTPQGANLTINNSFFRGSDGPEGVGSNFTGLYGVRIFDADAVFMFNNDLGGYRISDLTLEPTTRANNHHFLQNYFDATVGGPCVDVGGTGVKAQITMTGNWIASAGQFGSADVRNTIGMRIRDEGTYGPWNMTGGRVYNTAGRGVEVLARSIPLAITGVQFESFGTRRVQGANEGLYINTGVNGNSIHLSSSTFFNGSNGEDVETSGTANLFSLTANRGNGRVSCGARPLLSAANVFLGGEVGCN
jgi:hypothetical protein